MGNINRGQICAGKRPLIHLMERCYR